jgi:hypothetical protein
MKNNKTKEGVCTSTALCMYTLTAHTFEINMFGENENRDPSTHTLSFQKKRQLIHRRVKN